MNSNYGPSEETDHNEEYAPIINNASETKKNESESTPTDLTNKFFHHCKKNKHLHMYSIFHSVVSVFAIYLSFKCNRGLNLLDLLFAMFCPVLYVIYRTAVCNELIKN